jgi:hypothetical protein
MEGGKSFGEYQHRVGQAPGAALQQGAPPGADPRLHVLFDGGIKKVCRSHQYFGVLAARKRMLDREGGIIWHSQGSGKSLTMVWLTRNGSGSTWRTRACSSSPTARNWTSQIVRVFKRCG